MGLDKNSKKKKAIHAVDMSAPIDSTPTFKPYRKGARDESRQFAMLDCDVFQGLWYDDRGQLTDFCFEQRAEVDGESMVVARIDCCHGEAHMHKMNPDGSEASRKVLMPIESQDDLKRAYGAAEDAFYDGWENNMIRWKREL